MEQETLFGLVLDKSGSMASVTMATVDGVNKLLAEQKGVPGKLYFSETQFDNSLQTPYVGVDVGLVPAMTPGWGPHSYSPNGGTALFDAVGTTIKGMEKWAANKRFKGQVKVAILTDGQENSSREWHIWNPRVENDAYDLLGLIEWKQKEGWEFLFLGAGGSAWLERTFGPVVTPEYFHAYTNDVRSNAAVYAGVSTTLTNSRTLGTSFNSSVLATNVPSNTMTMTSGTPGVPLTFVNKPSKKKGNKDKPDEGDLVGAK